MKPSNLKKLRLELGMTPKAIADKMRMSVQLIYNIEHDKKVKESSLIFYELALKEEKRKRDYARKHRNRATA